MKLITEKSYHVSLILLLSVTLLTFMRAINNISIKNKLQLQISTLVTFIASCHYLLMILSPEKVVIYRYFDWFFTTPLLLIDLCLTYNITDFNFILKIVSYNSIMLLSGFLGELQITPKYPSMIAGFIPFILLFRDIYKKMPKTKENKKLFYFFGIIWSIYGIIYPINNNEFRNLCYNILDIISKAGFGVYLYSKTFKLNTF